MSPDRARQLYQRWMDMWNGKLDAANEIFSAGVVAHPAPMTVGEPPAYRGPEGIRQMVKQGRAIFDRVTFRAEADPIVEGDRLACRWVAEGTYAGGMAGATAMPGTPLVFRGIDVWHLENGVVTEYWVSSDGLHLMAQLGANH